MHIDPLSPLAQLKSALQDPSVFLRERAHRLPDIMALKKRRRVSLGPLMMVHFECLATLVWQIQEMLRIEGGGDAQMAEELEAYAPLLPGPCDLKATVMIEIPDASERLPLLRTLGDIEHHLHIVWGTTEVKGEPIDPEGSRMTADGKTSSVHFIRFPFPSLVKDVLEVPGQKTGLLRCTHPRYCFEAPFSGEGIHYTPSS